MLILSRKVNEEIIIDDNISVMVTDIQDGKVKLGIKAPRDIPVHRKEIQQKIERDRNA